MSDPMYKVYIEKSCEKEIKKIPREDLYKIIQEIKKLATNPRPAGCRKISGSKKDWRIRIGTYRVICEIDEAEKSVRVMIVRHRSKAYR